MHACRILLLLVLTLSKCVTASDHRFFYFMFYCFLGCFNILMFCVLFGMFVLHTCICVAASMIYHVDFKLHSCHLLVLFFVLLYSTYHAQHTVYTPSLRFVFHASRRHALTSSHCPVPKCPDPS